MPYFRRKYRIVPIAVLLIILTAITLTGCSSQKKLDKKVLKLDQGRAWPYNYTFIEYFEQLEYAYNKRELLAMRQKQAKKTWRNRENKDLKKNKTLAVLKITSKRNEKDIKRLKKDKEFYRAYKIRARLVSKTPKDNNEQTSQIRNETKAQTKARESYEKELKTRKAKSNKKHEKSKKERQERTDAQLENLRERRDAIENKDAVINKEVSIKEKEIAKLLKEQSKAPEEDKEYYDDEIDFIREEIKSINEQKGDTQGSLDSMDLVIDRFIELHYTTDSTSTKGKRVHNTPLPYTVN